MPPVCVILDLIKKLRNLTGVSIAEIKQALQEANGDEERAKEILRAKGALKSAKRSGKQTSNGVIEAYVHSNKKIGVLVELLCETDFVTRNEQFQNLAHEIALQVASMHPEYVARDDVPEEILEHEKDIYSEELGKSSKSSKVIDQIVNGKLEKYYQEVCLLDQPYIKDQNLTIRDLIHQAVLQLGENIKVGRFIRFET